MRWSGLPTTADFVAESGGGGGRLWTLSLKAGGLCPPTPSVVLRPEGRASEVNLQILRTIQYKH